MLKYNLQFFGGRGASAGGGKIPMEDGPQGGGNGGSGKSKFGQPHTPQVVPSGSIRQQIGAKGEPIKPNIAVKTVNPYRDVEWGDYSENCQRCAVAYELNRRGYNVEAEATYGAKDPYPRNNNWAKAFKDAKLEDVGGNSTAIVNKRIIEKMKMSGDGSRALVKVKYNQIEGHVFNVEYKNNKLYYYDAQTGTAYKPETVFDNVVSRDTQILRVSSPKGDLAISDDVRKMVRKKTTK